MVISQIYKKYVTFVRNGTIFDLITAPICRNMRIFLLTLTLFVAGAALLRAQDDGATRIDGPVVKADSLQSRPHFHTLMPAPPIVDFSTMIVPMAIPRFETRQQRAARLQLQAMKGFRNYYLENILPWMQAEMAENFFRAALTGYVRLSGTNPMILAREPGMRPYENFASPSYYPQTVRSEFDMATGTYKTVPISWQEYQANYRFHFHPGNFNNGAIPQIDVTPGDRIKH